MNIISRQIQISGHVQGVGFRYFVQKEAIKYGIKGYVKNMNNGNVFIHAECSELNLDFFLAACRKGPAMARVQDIDIEPADLQNFQYFDIRY